MTFSSSGGEASIRRPTTDTKIIAIRAGSGHMRPDTLATEEPLEIRVHGPGQDATSLTVTMRTPGNDFDLAVGLLFNEGILKERTSLKTVCYCSEVSTEDQRYNVVTVEMSEPFDHSFRERSFFSSSACGVCGTTTIEDLATKASRVETDVSVNKDTILDFPDLMFEKQKIFKQTGGLHGAGIFDLDGRLEIVREDIGRHNALDKIVGHYFMNGELPLNNKILALSGRIGFELVQKAAMAAIPIIVAVSAPSSLAVQTAETLGITLVGFVRRGNANIYSHPERIHIED